MQEFLATLLSFPTAVFTGLIALVCFYWLTVIFGALDLDSLDAWLGLDAMDAGLDGALESLDAVEGVDLGAGGADVDAGVDVDAADGGPKAGVLGGLLTAMGVRGIPMTVVGSFVLFWAWILSYLGTKVLGPFAATLLVGAFLGMASLAFGLVLGAISSRPFRRIFVTVAGEKRASLVGKMCTVTSAGVDAVSGRAEIEDGGSGFIAEVRCPQDNDLERGSKALVFGYEPGDGVFFVSPVDAALTKAERVAVIDE